MLAHTQTLPASKACATLIARLALSVNTFAPSPYATSFATCNTSTNTHQYQTPTPKRKDRKNIPTFLSLELHQRTNRSKDLILHNRHIGFDTRKHRRLNEIPLTPVSLSANMYFRSFLLTGANESHHTIKLKLRDLRAVFCFWIKRRSGIISELFGELSKVFKEFVVDSFLDEDTGCSHAGLAHVYADCAWRRTVNILVIYGDEVDVQDSSGSPFQSLLQIRIIKNNRRTLPSQFKRNLFQIRLRSCLKYFTSSESASRERNLLNPWVLSNGLARGISY